MTSQELTHFKTMVRVWRTKSLLFCLRYDPLIVFRRQNHITFIFMKTMSHDLLVQMVYSYFSIWRQKISEEQAFRVLPSKNLRSMTASKLTFKGKLSLDIAACKGPQYVPFNSCSSTLHCLFSNSLIIKKN